MKRTWSILLSVAIIGFIAGFLTTLALHRQVRPTIESNQQALETAIVSESPSPVSQVEFEEVKTLLSQKEQAFAKAKEAHRITEGHARALVSEMQVYRNSESELLQSIEQQKEALTEKIKSLDSKITETVALTAQRPKTYDYERINELNALLAYPHPLNSNSVLNPALTEQPEIGLVLVNARFEIMIQAEHYPHTDAIYDSLEKLVAELPESAPAVSIDNVFCSEVSCELQVKVGKPSPYFDSWRWLLDQLSTQPNMVDIQHNFSTESAQAVYGFVILKVGS
ncbi:hypothetical protein QWZ13_05690 [Reinekea marina]|uniref:MSHA biogenesis protein MshI n=1 Tax=Reinekea marina TaxID=1310421 RepID=A0ABV7WMY8_9GAMM|nr:hypothetical protein [Reinekea marina]MDN3648398.1 hypothetical protein [Reinekea marina]